MLTTEAGMPRACAGKSFRSHKAAPREDPDRSDRPMELPEPMSREAGPGGQPLPMPEKAAAALLDGREPDCLLAEQQGAGDIGHRPARVHRRFLQAPVRLGLREAEALNEEHLGPVHELA